MARKLQRKNEDPHRLILQSGEPERQPNQHRDSQYIEADSCGHSEVAEEARKDSSLMITIAAVTMLFLPGTFVSVCLSFLKVQQSANVKRTLFSA